MAIEVPEPIIRKIGKQAGIRSLRDSYKYVLGEDPVEIADIPAYDPEFPNISKEFNLENMSPERKKLFAEVYQFSKNATRDYRTLMRNLMSNYAQNRGSTAFTPEMAEKMIAKGQDSPQFKIKDREAAEQFVTENNLMDPSYLQDESVLLVFDLPPIISRFWYRSAQEAESGSHVPVKESEVEWGYFFRGSMPAIWSAVGKAENEGNLDLYRINSIGQHDPNNYHYVWEVIDKSKKPHFPEE